MQVVENQHDRSGGGLPAPERVHAGDQLGGKRLAGQFVAWWIGRDAEQCLQHAAMLGRRADQRAIKMGANRFGRVVGHDAQHATQQADAQAIRLGRLIGVG